MRRALVAGLVFVLGLATISSIAATDASAKKQKKTKVSLAIKTANQAGLLKAKKLKVQVRSNGKTKVRLSAFKGKSGKLFRKKTVKFKKRGKRTISLSLTQAGRKALGQCGAQKVKVVGKYRRGKKKATASRSKRLAKASNRCQSKPPQEFTTVPLGDNPERCDFLDSTVCLQPFPNDYYTKADPSTPTGRRLDIKLDSTPANTAGKHIDVTDINRADGWSPGNAITLKVPGLDTPAAFQNSGLVPLSNLHAYDDPNQSVIVIEAATGQRQPIWAELDSNPTTVDPKSGSDGGINADPSNTEDVNLIVRPAKNFKYGGRYIVAFRNLKDAANQPIESPVGFRVYRDNLPTQQEVVESRRDHMNSVINDVVTKGGVDRSSLYMAWDFTVASEKSIASRALQIRDDAFSRLGDDDLADRKIEGASPNVVIDAVCNAGDASTCKGSTDLGVPSGNMLRYVEGHLADVPCYLNTDGCGPGTEFNFKADNTIDFDESFTMDVPFRCIVPKSVQPGGAGTAVTAGPTGIYGHGLLGDYKQATSAGPSNVASQGGGVWCGANWDGFSTPDLIKTIVPALQDMSNFEKAVDRMQQGFVNFMLLQRAMIHPGGFAALDAFKLDDDGNPGTAEVPVIDVSGFPDTRGQYMGISQGGIMGGSLMALSPDSDYGVLGVPGMNYSTLLQRSVDSDQYFKSGFGLYHYYTDLAERPVLLGLMQLLWDRGEANGYANSMTTDPLDNTPPHSVLMRVAFGDHQVSNYTAEVEARTIGASVYAPALNAGRHWDSDPFLGINQQSTFPFDGGSMLVYYDSGPPSFSGTEGQGIATPPLQNVPPREEWGYGGDPHEHPRRSADGIDHAVTFLADGTINSCATITPEVSDASDAHCYANGYTGP